MIKGKFTSEQKKLFNLIRKANSLIKKAIKPIGKEVLSKMKSGCPVDSGALKKSLSKKEYAKGGKRAGVVVGVRAHYQQVKDGVRKVPNLYAKKANAATGFIDDALTPQETEKMTEQIRTEVRKLL